MSPAGISNWPLATSSSRGILASAAIHVVCGVALFWPTARAPSPLPLGVRRLGDSTLIEIGIAGPQASAPKPAPRRKPAEAVTKSDVVVPRAKEVPAPPVAAREREGADRARFGVADGVASSGRLGVGNGVDASERERYIYELRVLLEGRKVYPQISRHMKETGKVLVRFLIHRDGRIEKVEVARPSGFDRLNRAAQQLVEGLRQYKPLPEEVHAASLRIEVPIEYVLN